MKRNGRPKESALGYSQKIVVVSRAPDSFGKESGNFSRVSVCQCRNVDTQDLIGRVT